MFAFSCCLGSLTLPGKCFSDSSNKFRAVVGLLGCWGFGIVERQLIHFVFVIFHGYLMLYFIISVVKHIRGNYGPAVGRTSNVGRVY